MGQTSRWCLGALRVLPPLGGPVGKDPEEDFGPQQLWAVPPSPSPAHISPQRLFRMQFPSSHSVSSSVLAAVS